MSTTRMPTKFWRNAATSLLALLMIIGGMALYAGSSAAQSPPASGSAAAPGNVILLTPSRIADSRVWNSFPTFRGLESSDLQIVGRGGVPMTGVSGAVLNVTVVNPQSVGFLTVWPFDEPQPDVSNLNFVPGETIANTVIVKLSQPDGTVRIYNGSGGAVDVLVDVEGYISA